MRIECMWIGRFPRVMGGEDMTIVAAAIAYVHQLF